MSCSACASAPPAAAPAACASSSFLRPAPRAAAQPGARACGATRSVARPSFEPFQARLFEPFQVRLFESFQARLFEPFQARLFEPFQARLGPQRTKVREPE